MSFERADPAGGEVAPGRAVDRGGGAAAPPPAAAATTEEAKLEDSGHFEASVVCFDGVFADLRQYKEENGNLTIFTSHPLFVSVMDKLSAAGMEELLQKRFYDQLEALEKFSRKHGDCFVPVEHPTLGEWVRVQHGHYMLFKKRLPSPLTKKRFAKLEKIAGFDEFHQFEEEKKDDFVAEEVKVSPSAVVEEAKALPSASGAAGEVGDVPSGVEGEGKALLSGETLSLDEKIRLKTATNKEKSAVKGSKAVASSKNLPDKESVAAEIRKKMESGTSHRLAVRRSFSSRARGREKDRNALSNVAIASPREDDETLSSAVSTTDTITASFVKEQQKASVMDTFEEKMRQKIREEERSQSMPLAHRQKNEFSRKPREKHLSTSAPPNATRGIDPAHHVVPKQPSEPHRQPEEKHLSASAPPNATKGIAFEHPLRNGKLEHHPSKKSIIGTFEKAIKRKIGRGDRGHAAPAGASDENDAGRGLGASMPANAVDDSFERRVLLGESSEGTNEGGERVDQSLTVDDIIGAATSVTNDYDSNRSWDPFAQSGNNLASGTRGRPNGSSSSIGRPNGSSSSIGYGIREEGGADPDQTPPPGQRLNMGTFKEAIRRRIGRGDRGQSMPAGESSTNDAGRGLSASVPANAATGLGSFAFRARQSAVGEHAEDVHGDQQVDRSPTMDDIIDAACSLANDHGSPRGGDPLVRSGNALASGPRSRPNTSGSGTARNAGQDGGTDPDQTPSSGQKFSKWTLVFDRRHFDDKNEQSECVSSVLDGIICSEKWLCIPKENGDIALRMTTQNLEEHNMVERYVEELDDLYSRSDFYYY